MTSSSLAENDVFRQQVMEYMKFRGPVYMADDIVGKIKKLPFNNVKTAEICKSKVRIRPESVRTQRAYTGGKGSCGSTDGCGRSVVKYRYWFCGGISEKTVFRLAAKSLQKYLNEEIDAPFPEEAPDQLTYDVIEEYLNYPFSWDSGNTTFDDQMYKNMVTLLAVYQVAEADSEVRAEISERFTSEEIQTFNSIKSVINGNISSMNKIYSDAAKTYRSMH